MKLIYKLILMIVIIILAIISTYILLGNNWKDDNKVENKVNQEEINQLGDLYTNIGKYDCVVGVIGKDIVSSIEVPTKYFVIENTSTTNAPFYSQVYFSLPEVLQAKTDNDLNTLVKLTRSTSNETDNKGKTVKRESIDITVIDIPSNNIIVQSQMNSILPEHITDADIASYLEALCGYNLGDLYNKIDIYAQIKPSSTEIRKANNPTKYFIIEKNSDIGGKFAFSQINNSLSKELVATSSSELNTLVLLEYSKTKFGTYGNGSIAYRLDLKITAFDMETGRLINQGHLFGNPPTSISSTNTLGAAGIVTYEQIVSYLENLASYN